MADHKSWIIFKHYLGTTFTEEIFTWTFFALPAFCHRTMLRTWESSQLTKLRCVTFFIPSIHFNFQRHSAYMIYIKSKSILITLSIPPIPLWGALGLSEISDPRLFSTPWSFWVKLTQILNWEDGKRDISPKSLLSSLKFKLLCESNSELKFWIERKTRQISA